MSALYKHCEQGARNQKSSEWVVGTMAALALSGGIYASNHLGDNPIKSTEAVTYHSPERQFNDMHDIRLARAKAIAVAIAEHAKQLQLVRSSVPMSLYGAELVHTNGNVIKANSVFMAERVPPMSLSQALRATQKLHYPFPKAEQKKVEQQVSKWEAVTPTTALVPVKQPQKMAHNILQSLSMHQEKLIRDRIIETARGYLGVQEVAASNTGSLVDRFTGGRPESWCGDFISFVLEESGIPLSGGGSYHQGRPDYQVSRIFANPHSPSVISMQSWYQQNAYYFNASQRLPEPGDVAMIHEPDGGHGMFVERLLPHNQVLLLGGNTGDAVAERAYDLNDPLIDYGSLFEK